MPINRGKIVSEMCRAAGCWFKAAVDAPGKKRRQRILVIGKTNWNNPQFPFVLQTQRELEFVLHPLRFVRRLGNEVKIDIRLRNGQPKRRTQFVSLVQLLLVKPTRYPLNKPECLDYFSRCCLMLPEYERRSSRSSPWWLTTIRLPNGFVKHCTVLEANSSPPEAAHPSKPPAF